jgi:hypothetical protein
MNFILDTNSKADKHIIFEGDFNSLEVWESDDRTGHCFSFKDSDFELFFSVKNEDIINMRGVFEKLLEVEKWEHIRDLNTPGTHKRFIEKWEHIRDLNTPK